MEKKTPFIPTVMRCNQDQFNQIKPKLSKLGIDIGVIGNFDSFGYLVNNIANNEKKVANIMTCDPVYGRACYEKWDEEIFLRNLGGEEAEASERKIDIEFTGPEADAMKSTIKGLNSIVATQKMTIENWIATAIAKDIIIRSANEVIVSLKETIAIKDETIERLQSRIAELEQTDMDPIKTNFFQSFINRIKKSYGKK